MSAMFYSVFCLEEKLSGFEQITMQTSYASIAVKVHVILTCQNSEGNVVTMLGWVPPFHRFRRARHTCIDLDD